MTSKRSAVGIVFGIIFTLTSACSVTNTGKQIAQSLSNSAITTADTESSSFAIATWNIEHLAFPIFEGCRPRSNEEKTNLQHYVKSLNADIVALQEVASVEAVESIFPPEEWQIIMSERPNSDSYTCRKSGAASTQQKVAFTLRNSIDILEVNSLNAFGLNRSGLRYGLELTVDSPSGPMTLLNVHMKSGCFVDNYSREDSEACQTFAKQAPVLDKWVEKMELRGMPYMVLGDFNHRLSAPYNHLTRLLSKNSDNSNSSIENLGAHLIGCHLYYPAPIDHILAGNMHTERLKKTAKVHPFKNMAADDMLSDHCAISVQISDIKFPLSSAVKWQTTSKEYRFLTSAIYQSATEVLKNKTLPVKPWAVVMDVDETVLDNSQYQVSVEEIGAGYKPDTWNEWVASERATLVPGVKSFIQTVFQLGGKIALVTNRDRQQDQHTWKNMQALSIPVSTANTCLTGRKGTDKQAINGKSIINDKDLRRQQLKNGTANCYKPNGTRGPLFPELQIIMQVGDNIEDFSGITQEEADIEKLLLKSKAELILLPNPMYGSW